MDLTLHRTTALRDWQLFVLLLYAVQIQNPLWCARRAHRTGASDRRSTLAVSVAAVPVLGFALSMKAISPRTSQVSNWFPPAALPGLPLVHLDWYKRWALSVSAFGCSKSSHET